MTKRLIAVLPLLCVVMFAMGGNATTPTAAAPTTPSMSAPDAPAMCAPSDPEFGGCRWYCGSRSYTTQSQCQSHCSSACEEIC